MDLCIYTVCQLKHSLNLNIIGQQRVGKEQWYNGSMVLGNDRFFIERSESSLKEQEELFWLMCHIKNGLFTVMSAS